MERDFEYVREGFNFAMRILEDYFDRISLSISLDKDDFRSGINLLKNIDKDFSEKGLRGYMMENDLRIRMNGEIIERDAELLQIPRRELFSIWSAYLTSFFYPYAWFLQFTEHGREMKSRISESYSREIMENELKNEVRNLREWFTGVGLWAEEKVGQELLYPHHDFEDFWKRISAVKVDGDIYLDELKGFKFCKFLEKLGDLSPLEGYRKKMIVAEAMRYVDKTEEDFLIGLERLRKKLERREIRVEEIFGFPIKKSISFSPQLNEILGLYTEFNKEKTIKPWNIVKRKMEDICEKLDEFGEVELSEKGKELISFIQKEFEEVGGIESGKMYIDDLLKRPDSIPIYEKLREWLIDMDQFFERFSEKHFSRP